MQSEISKEMVADLEAALDAFWNVAYTQGQEQRGHDDEYGTAQKAEDDLRRAIAALSSRPAIGEGSRVPSPHEYAMEYEFRGDGDYTPTDAERTMIEDAICGYLGEVPALRSPPEPVAWQWRHRAKRQDGTWSDWSDWHEGHKPAMSTDSYEVEERPLYASQPSGQVAPEPVAEVRMEADYWSRGHFYKAHRKVAELLKGFSELPVGSKLYAYPTDGELVRAAREVEQWWLSEGMKKFNGAPYAIFALRAALSAKESGHE